MKPLRSTSADTSVRLPKALNRWWDYVETNNVLLPDEYDQIHRDLEPFWAVDPEQLRERQSAHEGHVDSYTIGKSRHGPIFVVNATLHVPEEREMHLDGARRMIEVLKPVEKWIPPFRAVFNPHDNPNQLLSWQLRQRALDAIAAGKYLDLNNMQGLEGLGWLTACHPRSPARLQGLDLDHPPVPPPLADSNRTRTFIHAHLPAMDPCLHPAHLHTHGQFLSHHGGPGLDAASALLAPQWSYSTTPLHVDLRPAAPNAWVADLGGEDLEWDEKEMTPEGREGRLLWRGSNTGIYAGSWLRWGQSQRQRLVGMAEETEGTIALMRPAEGDATLGREYQLHMHGEDKGREVKWEVKEVERAKLAGEVLDVHFAGKPIQCAQEICDQMEEMFDWRSNMNVREAGKYKYVMDVDGNGWSSRFKRLITSNAVILKATVYPEWFSERIMPWVHYVPVQNDYSDLFDILTFFRGVPGDEGHTHHDALARRIAEKGKEWSMTMWRREDLTAYMFRMMLEYARLLSVDRNEMSFEDIEDESSW